MKKNKATVYLFLALLCVWCPIFVGFRYSQQIRNILPAVFVQVWDKAKPAASTSLRNSNPEMLANQAALETAIAQDHEFSTGGTNSGKHEVITFEEESSAGASSTDEGHLQVIDGGSQPEMAFTSEDGDELQFTKDGDLFSSDGLVVTEASTFNGSITLGAGDDLIGSATSDITFNTNKFTVAGATGNTLVAGTLDVSGNIDPTTYETTNGGFQNSDTMASAADDKIASSDSIVKYTTLDAGGVLMHDAEGGFVNADVDGTKTKVYTLYLTGTLDADVSTSVAHGRADIDKILSVNVIAFSSGTSKYRVKEHHEAASSTQDFTVSFDGTNVVIEGVGSQIQGQKYRITML